MKSPDPANRIETEVPASSAAMNGGILNLKHALISEISAHRLIPLPQDKSNDAFPPDPQQKEAGRLDQNKNEPGKEPPKDAGKDAGLQPLPDNSLSGGQDPLISDRSRSNNPEAFQWESAIKQSMIFLAIAHGFRLATEPSTRRDLRGPFFREYIESVKNLRGWDDGDPTFVNYLGHPMEGAVAGFIQIHNDPKVLRQEFELKSKTYWRSRFKAMAWAAAWSAQFELGPLSEASLGNVGLKPSTASPHPMAYVDLVITPTLGMAWLVGEDLLDRYVIRWVESKTSSPPVRILVRSFLNPTRSFANIHRGKWFWHRDDR